MSADDYTPTTEDVRGTHAVGYATQRAGFGYDTSVELANGQFDRWLDAIEKAAYNDGYSDGRWDW